MAGAASRALLREPGLDGDIQHWLTAVRAGVATTFGVSFAASIYLAMTWQQPHREVDLILWAVACAGGVLVWWLPTERIIDSRFRNAFFLTWSAWTSG